MIKILSILHHHPKFSALGGAERRFIQVTKLLAKKGLKITVIKPPSSILKENHKNIEIVELNSIQLIKPKLETIYLDKILWTITTTIHLLQKHRKKDYNLTLSSNFSIPNLLPAYIFSRIKKIPLCVIAHHLDVTTPNQKCTLTNIYKQYRNINYNSTTSLIKTISLLLIITILKKAEQCITMTKTMAKALTINGINPKKIFISSNGVNNLNNKKIEEKNKKYDYIFVGRISKEKGIYDLLTAFTKILEQNKTKKMVIIGDGPELENLRKKIKKLKLEEKILVTGPCSDKQLHNFLKKSRVFVFPSLYEGWGLAIAEALNSGLPVICYNIPSLKEVFNNCPSVFFVPIKNINKLIEKMEEIPLRPDYHYLTVKAKEYAKKFTWEKVAYLDFKAIQNCLKQSWLK